MSPAGQGRVGVIGMMIRVSHLKREFFVGGSAGCPLDGDE